MPITQSRMLALIAAAEDYQQAWQKAQHAFIGIDREVTAGRITIPEAWSQVQFLLNSALQLNDPEVTPVTIATERTHFKHVAQRNKWSAEWQRQRRAGVATPKVRRPRTTREQLARERLIESLHAQEAAEKAPAEEARLRGIPPPTIELDLDSPEPPRKAPLPAVGADSDLDLGEPEPDSEAEVTPGYIPQELSPERKAEIDAEAQLLREQQELLTQLGIKLKAGEQ